MSGARYEGLDRLEFGVWGFGLRCGVRYEMSGMRCGFGQGYEQSTMCNEEGVVNE